MPPERLARRHAVVVLAMMSVSLAPSAWLAWRNRDMPHFGSWHDDTLYVSSAKSLAQGHGYRIESLPDRPYQTKYPPLYPLLLSALWRINPEFPSNLQLAVLFAWLMSLVAYGLYRGRGSDSVSKYLLAGKTMPWYAMGLSILATQASAITFISTTGQAYVDGMRFVQFYFGLPVAMVILSATAVPLFHRANRRGPQLHVPGGLLLIWRHLSDWQEQHRARRLLRRTNMREAAADDRKQ